MPIDTNLNVAPYYDDFDPEKNYYRVLFRPGVSLQAREITQLQSILQDQIEKFGDNVYRIGSIIKGCNLTTDFNYRYVKILDTQVDGQPVAIARFANTLVVQEGSGLSALVVNYNAGFESLNPDLNTLYIKYINTGSAGQKVFSNSQVLTVYDRNRTVESVTIVNGGTSYSNSDSVIFTSSDGTGAVATITTNANGVITDVSMTSKGSGYITAPTVSVNTSTGSSASLTALNYIAQITVAGSTFAAPVGTGSAVKCAEGVVYQKGHFIRVEPQETILTKYDTNPDQVVVGFSVNESIVNSSVDETLLDLAIGAPNYTAPGANRLKLTPTLSVLTTAQSTSNNEFLPLLEFEEGKVVKDRTDTQFNSVNKELAKRTFDESGNYVLSQFTLNTQEISGNATHFDLTVSPGVAYVNGNRVQLLNSSKKAVRKGTDTATNVNYSISTSYGNYIRIRQLVGQFDIKNGTTINLRDTAGTDVTDNAGNTPTTPGVVIGTAKVKSLEYVSGIQGTPEAEYRLYLFDVTMNTGRSFGEVRSVSINNVALADVILNTAGKAALNDVNLDTLVYDSGIVAVKEFTSEEFSFRTSTNATFTTAGSVTISFSGGNTLPYSGTLSDSLKEDIIVIPSANIYSDTATTGTVTANTSTSNITGVATSFTTEFEVGDYISIGNTSAYSLPQRITTIFSDTVMQLSGTFSGLSGPTANAVSNNIFKAYPGNVPIDFTKQGKDISVPSTTSLTVDLGHGIRAETTFTVYHDLENFEPSVRTKTLNNPLYVKLSTDSLANTTTGPWCLGVPDVLSIEGVYVGSSNSYSEATTDYKEEFELQTGQKDNYYGLSYLKLKPNSTLTLSATSCLLVKFKAFTHGTGKYLSAESYPVDDTTVPLPTNKIRTQDIPYFVSPTTGGYLDLRNSLDFRPIVANTAVLASSAGSASIDPARTETLTAGDKFFPSPSRSFESSIEYYLDRIDRIIIDDVGVVGVVEGLPATNPTPPVNIKGAMDLALVRVSPFPSLSAKEASDIGRPDLASSVEPRQTKGYTMKDIGELEKRIRTLEYYTLISSLESNTINITIPSEANSQIERFKNGFIVDSFDNYNVARTNDNEFRAIIDNSRLQPLTNTTVVDVLYNSSNSSSVQKTGDIVTLPYNHKSMISQPLANKQRTLVEEYWNFAGNMTVVPPVDNFFDVNNTATSAINVDIATPMNALVNAINQAFRANATTSTSVRNQSGLTGALINDWGWSGIRQWFTDTITTTTTTGARINVSANTVSETTSVGDFLTNVNVNPYVREQQIFIYASGLRPGARHYVFFDGVDLTTNSRPAQITNFTNATRNNFTITGAEGSPLVANNTGEVAVAISIPGDTFITGEKNILIMDIDSLNSEESATSKALGKFSAFSLQGESTNVTFSTRNFDTTRNNIFTGGTFTDTSVSVQRNNWWERVVFWWPDPLAQTFTVERQQGGDIVFATKLDLFFRAKDPNLGVTVEIRETTESGTPSQSILPFSKIHLQSSQVNVSDNASVPTTFTFESPVALRVDRDYAIVITPDQNSPEYRIWTAQTGLPDVTNSSLISNGGWGKGTMFFSTSGKAFTPVQNEDVKFNLYRADFTASSGTLIVNNGDYEFLKTEGASGTFRGGEDVAQMSNTYINTTLTTNNASAVIGTSTDLTATFSVGDTMLMIYSANSTAITGNVSVSGTTLSNGTSVTNNSFTANFSNGDFIRIGNNVRQVISVSNNTTITLDANVATITDGVHYTIDPVFDVVKVTSANSSSVTVNKYPTLNTNSSIVVSAQRVVSGIIGVSVPTTNTLILANSSASSDTFKFRSANSTYFGYVVGDDSQATAKISTIENVSTSFFTTLFNTLITKGTSITLSGTLTKNSGSTDTSNYSISATNVIKFNEEAVVKSKSNEIVGSTVNKSFRGALTMATQYSDVSPVFDLTSSILFNNYVINNDITNENTRYGNARCKYITKTLTLADGLDAEDIKVYLDAYKPSGTEIDIYAKILNASDVGIFEDKDWSKLTQTTPSSVLSSSLNENDIREFEYTFSSTPTTTRLPGVVTVFSNTTVTGSGTNFNSTLASGDLVKIINTNSLTDYDIVPVATVGGATSLTLSTNLSFSGSGRIIEKVTNPKQAFKYNRNSNIVRYYNDSKSAMDGYKYIALKIVLRSSRTTTIPKVDNVRAIACSV